MIDKLWKDAPVPTPDLGGDGVTARGGDPLIDLSGTNAIQPLWSNAPVPTPEGRETANSVSGLPLQPSRTQPSETTPEPPSLTEHSVSTIDKR